MYGCMWGVFGQAYEMRFISPSYWSRAPSWNVTNGLKPVHLSNWYYIQDPLHGFLVMNNSSSKKFTLSMWRDNSLWSIKEDAFNKIVYIMYIYFFKKKLLWLWWLKTGKSDLPRSWLLSNSTLTSWKKVWWITTTVRHRRYLFFLTWKWIGQLECSANMSIVTLIQCLIAIWRYIYGGWVGPPQPKSYSVNNEYILGKTRFYIIYS